jgi:hypothetical protein
VLSDVPKTPRTAKPLFKHTTALKIVGNAKKRKSSVAAKPEACINDKQALLVMPDPLAGCVVHNFPGAWGDIREGKITDRYLAPTISKFVIAIQREEEREPTLDQEEKELRREIVNLHRRWGKVREEPKDEEKRERARRSAVEKRGFTRTVQRKNLIWPEGFKRDSIARAYDPEHIQQREFLDVWTSEELASCVEKGYKWSIKRTTWNHLCSKVPVARFLPRPAASSV